MNNDIIHRVHANVPNDLCDFQSEESFEEIGWEGWRTSPKLSAVSLVWWMFQSQRDTGEDGSKNNKWLPTEQGIRSICLQFSPPCLSITRKCLFCNNVKAVRPSTFRSASRLVFWKTSLLFYFTSLRSLHAATLFPVTAPWWGDRVPVRQGHVLGNGIFTSLDLSSGGDCSWVPAYPRCRPGSTDVPTAPEEAKPFWSITAKGSCSASSTSGMAHPASSIAPLPAPMPASRQCRPARGLSHSCPCSLKKCWELETIYNWTISLCLMK